MICKKHLNEIPMPVIAANEAKIELERQGYRFNENDDTWYGVLPILTANATVATQQPDRNVYQKIRGCHICQYKEFENRSKV